MPWTVRLDKDGVLFSGNGVKIAAVLLGGRTPEVERSLQALQNRRALAHVKGRYIVRQRARHPRIVWIYGAGVKVEIRFPSEPPQILVDAIRDVVQHRREPGTGRRREREEIGIEISESPAIANAREQRYRETVARRGQASANS